MKKNVFHLSIASLAVITFFLGLWMGGGFRGEKSARPERRVLYYVDPMNPANHYEKPGIAPCGMPLEPVYADGGPPAKTESAIPGSVTIAPERQQLIGIKIEVAEKGPAVKTVRLLGKVAADETRVYRLNSSIQGWIREVSPYATGSFVKKGTLLATFYAPEFLAAEQAYIYSLTSSTHRPTFKVGSAQPNLIGQTTQQYEDNLRNLGMGENQIKELARTREFQENIRIESPANGFILARNISPGLRFDKVTEFYRIADLRRVWILLDAYEDEARYFHPGDTVTVHYLGRPVKARVSDVLPPFDPVTRTLKVRLIADNPGYTLRPDMFVDVEFPVSLPPAVTVPVDAVIDSGLKKTVFIYKGDGLFEPRSVETGAYLDNRVEIVKGIMPGESIVVSGNFLIDSESRMKAPPAETAGEIGMDPVCGMPVEVKRSRSEALTSEFKGESYFFCSRMCKERFDKAPRAFLEGKGSGMTAVTGKPASKPREPMKMHDRRHSGTPMEMPAGKPSAVMHDQMEMDDLEMDEGDGNGMESPAATDGTPHND